MKKFIAAASTSRLETPPGSSQGSSGHWRVATVPPSSGTDSIAARGSVQTIHRRGGERSAEAAKAYQRAAERVCDVDFKMAIREADLNSLRRLGSASLCLSSSLRFASLNRRMTPSRDRAEHGQRNGAKAKWHENSPRLTSSIPQRTADRRNDDRAGVADREHAGCGTRQVRWQA
jgi:hypothetical protein